MIINMENFFEWAKATLEERPYSADSVTNDSVTMLWVIAQTLTIIAAELDEIVRRG